jgi:hypothetical protein
VSGVEVLAPRIETVELDADDLEGGLGERFLAACEVPEELADVSLDEARTAAASTGAAVIEVTIDDYGTGVRVSAAGTTAAATA